jgi:hypothetical protein
MVFLDRHGYQLPPPPPPSNDPPPNELEDIDEELEELESLEE